MDGWLVGWLVGQSVAWWGVGLLVGGWIGWLASQSFGCLVGLLVVGR
jgi:hypothetical protein